MKTIKKKMPMKSRVPKNTKLWKRVSYFRCMKKPMTKHDLMAAMISATNRPALPRLASETATVSTVRTSRAPKTPT